MLGGTEKLPLPVGLDKLEVRARVSESTDNDVKTSPHQDLPPTSIMSSFSPTAARTQFPALQQSHQVYFDNAGGSQALSTVASSYD